MKDFSKRQYRKGSTRSLSWSPDSLRRWFQNLVRSRYSRPSPRTVWFILLAILLVSGLACQVVWQHVQVSRVQHKYEQLQEQRAQIMDDIRKEKNQVAQLERLDRISHLAIHELGMRPDLKIQVVKVHETRRVELPVDRGTTPPQP